MRSIPVASAALFLDLDGTLAAIEPKPDDVVVNHERNAVLERALTALEGRVAIISGRSITEVDRIIAGAVPCVAGVHGLERRLADGAVVAVSPHPSLPEVTDRLKAVARARSGLLVEEKPASVAIHYRNVPGAREAVRQITSRLAKAAGLVLQSGSMVAELKTPGPDKSDSVRSFMQEDPFRGASPIFIGDDVTDEAGFAAANALHGFGVLVGQPRETHARGRLDSPTDVLAWLTRSMDAGVFELESIV